MKYFKIGFIGSGNLAWHLAQDLEKAGHFIPVVYSRDLVNATLLASQLYDTQVVESLDFSSFNLDVVIIAISDDAIQMVAELLIVDSSTVVIHTSGVKPLEVLSSLGDDIGVFYPLQTFTKIRGIDFSEIPICIEASNAQVHDVLFSLARSVSNKVVVMDSEQRKTLHLAAVFTSNFTNHMLFWSKTLLEIEQIDFELLKPLANETISKAFALGPESAQTGPARRGDLETMKMHLKLIESNPELTAFYQAISRSIQFNS